MNQKLRYTGKKLPIYQDSRTGEIIYPYIPGEALIKAVNLAITLKRPLLLEGEPGGGKTELARAVAHELKLPYQEFSVKSTSKGIDIKYQYDTIGRLRDAQLVASLGQEAAKQFIENDAEKYQKLEALGKAFSCKDQRTVVLIDEIDKADVDFPNDLLEELDKKKFYIKETGETIEANWENPPIIFITSNAQKKLPNAFLRRCLYYYVPFPDEEHLKEILQNRFPTKKHQLSPELQTTQPELVQKVDPELVEKAASRFLQLHQEMKSHEDERQSDKIVSTSELIDWFTVMLQAIEESETTLDNLKQQLDEKAIPFPETLLKTQRDREIYLGEGDNEEDEWMDEADDF